MDRKSGRVIAKGIWVAQTPGARFSSATDVPVLRVAYTALKIVLPGVREGIRSGKVGDF
jgi:hypothetical protein